MGAAAIIRAIRIKRMDAARMAASRDSTIFIAEALEEGSQKKPIAERDAAWAMDAVQLLRFIVVIMVSGSFL